MFKEYCYEIFWTILGFMAPPPSPGGFTMILRLRWRLTLTDTCLPGCSVVGIQCAFSQWHAPFTTLWKCIGYASPPFQLGGDCSTLEGPKGHTRKGHREKHPENSLKIPENSLKTPKKYPENTLNFMTFGTFSLCPFWVCPLHLSKYPKLRLHTAA